MVEKDQLELFKEAIELLDWPLIYQLKRTQFFQVKMISVSSFQESKLSQFFTHDVEDKIIKRWEDEYRILFAQVCLEMFST